MTNIDEYSQYSQLLAEFILLNNVYDGVNIFLDELDAFGPETWISHYGQIIITYVQSHAIEAWLPLYMVLSELEHRLETLKSDNK